MIKKMIKRKLRENGKTCYVGDTEVRGFRSGKAADQGRDQGRLGRSGGADPGLA